MRRDEDVLDVLRFRGSELSHDDQRYQEQMAKGR